MIRTGLDRLLAEASRLDGRRYALLSHAAAVARGPGGLQPSHLALAGSGRRPRVLFGPEHGFWGVEQDHVATDDRRDPLTGLEVRSLYGDRPESLRADPASFDGLDLLLVDLQDVGVRYYTYAATAVWAAEAALEAGCEVWVLDRPNPLGGQVVEGGLPRPGFESFVGAFRLPVRHGLTLGELVLLEARRRGFGGDPSRLRVLPVEGWKRPQLWPDSGRPWIAPSPNMPSFDTALVYPGLCLLEATTLSEGRGTARPFLWTGAPGIDAGALVGVLGERDLPGVSFLPVLFRPGYQKHAGELCAGVETVVTDAELFEPYRTGVEILAAVREVAPEALGWRSEPYEFVGDRPALDLLTGGPECREALEAGGAEMRRRLDAWMAGWGADEAAFRHERREVLLYAEGDEEEE